MNRLDTSLQWLKKEIESIPFGMVGLSVVIHAGRITRIEKHLIEKEQVTEDYK